MLKSPLKGTIAVGSIPLVGAELSAFTTRTLRPGLSRAVTSKRKRVNAPRCWPSFLPLSQTSATMLAPSNCSHWVAPVAGLSNSSRYQPFPRLYGTDVGVVWVMLAASFSFQVCGRVTLLQADPSLASAASSVSASSCTKRQAFLSSRVVVRASSALTAAESLPGALPELPPPPHDASAPAIIKLSASL